MDIKNIALVRATKENFKKKEPIKESVAIVEYKESIIKKIINKIKNIFFK